MLDEDSALVLMGHGSIYHANTTYSQLQFKLWAPGHGNLYVTTVKGYLEYGNTMSFMEGKGYEKVVLAPFVLVVGDHANNDIAGDDEDFPK